MADSGKSEHALREEGILALWKERDIFKKSLAADAPKGEYVFYDGPPFATGLPHYGHIVASVIKDAVPRFWTMRGYRVPRRWGWDCHGLPIENLVEKELGFKHKKDVLALGVAKFNELCRSKVLMYVDEWKKVIPRIGRWADMDDPYFTMSREYMESVWWVFKQLYEKGLVYEDYRAMHICPRCETTLSQSEVAEGYKEVKDLSVIAEFRLRTRPNTSILAWTTTPWTLPGNVALAVNPDIAYITIEKKDEDVGDAVRFILARDLAGKIFGDAEYSIVGEEIGSDLVGLEYEPLFDGYASDVQLNNRKNGWKVYAADFVSTNEGTGIVHIAPAFGADDMALGKREQLPFVQHVGMDGVIKPEVKELAGRSVKPIDDVQSTDIEVVKYLASTGRLFSKAQHEHSYPHCWRCDTPLINYATSSWFVKVEVQKEQLLKNAEPINWSPAHIKEGRWGTWLQGARDWSVSRQRFWASVIPIWCCEACRKERVFGSAAELEEASGQKVDDLHKHIVDEVAVPCECGGAMKRVPDVLDTWFDSGSMPYGQAHYPLENKERFEKTFPAQFIAEGQDQCRAWFYYLHVLATSIFGTRAFGNVIVNGIVLAEDGKKMSKKLKNYPDPMEIVEKYGADALRYYLLSSPVMQAENLNFSERGVEEAAKKHLGRLHNVLAFYRLYANSPDSPGTSGTPRDFRSGNVLDQWILARLAALIGEATDGYEAYRLDAAVRPLALFIDDLSVWYVRRSRERFKQEGEDKQAALATLRYVLHTLSRIMAPAMPFYAEYLFQAVREEEDEESVHLALWPEQPPLSFDVPRALLTMFAVRTAVSLALKEREQAGLSVRQPLSRLSLGHTDVLSENTERAEEYLAILREEVNVKEVVFSDVPGVSLDTALSEELREEGFVRELVRAIQNARKEAKMSPHDYAEVAIEASAQARALIEKYSEHIARSVKAREIRFADSAAASRVAIGAHEIGVRISKT